MPYSEPILDHQGLKAADIFRKEWRLLAFARASTVISYFWPIAWLTLLPLYLLWRIGGIRALVVVNKQISAELFWYLHLFLTSMDTFEMNYRQSWKDTLDAAKNGDSEVVMLNIFVGNESMAVPLLFDRSDATMNSDAETFKQLCMWYSWMQYKRGFGELVLPRRLARVDKVKICNMSNINPVLGERVKSYDLGRNASSNVVNFLNPDRLDPKQYFQTVDMLSNVQNEGLEFVRAWDKNNASIIALIPFVLSLVFAIIWIAVSIGHYRVDAQVAVQTAFTVAAFIVTAGALLIALFAFLDDKTGQT